jgi:GTPase
MLPLDPGKIMKAVLVGIQLPQSNESEVLESLKELERLANTMGAQVIGKMTQKRSSEKTATVLGDGKLKELAQWTGGDGIIGPSFVKKKHKAALKFENADSNEDEDNIEIDEESERPKDQADMVIFDCELSPSQLRNLESALKVKVYDRTGIIIEIFSRHARTKAARLQVEIARLTYLAPRIRETGAKEDKQEGGGGKGAGEKSIELDRRNIRDRIKELKEELAALSHEQSNRRQRRAQENCVALVGYTNAGKSSLMRALTGSEILVADKLFATLDTTVRQLYPANVPNILVSDTVGFIKKLPHDLVASFKSTLDEAHNASLLLYVVDASDPSFRSQLEVTQSVLAEVGVDDIESLLVLNKKDRLNQEELETLKKEFPKAYFLSTLDPKDVAAFRLKIIESFEKEMLEELIFVPYSTGGAIGEIRSKMRVLEESFNEKGSTYRVKADRLELKKLKEKYSL